ncbi:Imm26 family immunity protein [Microbulbifer sp. ANSA003]|uniref:Imm26 family immunity protein n=1 Tax=Microbulbifer sp. ANSA003 TaxID=3243360 RepID=UPI00404226B5
MSKLNLWGWNKKPRTLLRFIKVGDIFCFQRTETTFVFGRILGYSSIGHIVEIFNLAKKVPSITVHELNIATRALAPLIIDSYSLFDRKSEGEWRIIGRIKDFEPQDIDNVFFVYGVEGLKRKVDFNDNDIAISDKEAEGLPRYSPRGHEQIIEALVRQAKLDASCRVEVPVG